MKVKFMFKLRSIYNKRALFFTCLMFIAVLFSSCFVSVFSGFSSFALGAPVSAGDEDALRIAVFDAIVPTVIVLTDNIQLTNSSLEIPADKHITLTSAGSVAQQKLGGVTGQPTIIVEGVLVLDGIVVTHDVGRSGSGVHVKSGGALILVDGKISGNIAQLGGGVYNEGVFTMVGGVIINNTINNNFGSRGGGGVYNTGNFTVSGVDCVIANNTAGSFSGGGGVYNTGNFTVSGVDCVIANNTATGGGGGGVYNDLGGNFTVSGVDCVIANNTATTGYGGGVYNDYSSGGVHSVYSTFVMFSGKISNNKANSGGGVHNNAGDVFVLYDGVIADNTAYDGGGVNNWGNFTMFNGLILNNKAILNGQGGGGVYTHISPYLDNMGFFTMFDGVIANNTADSSPGGGVYLYGLNSISGGFAMLGGVIANNTARWGGGVYNNYGNFTLSGGVIANNTAPSGGGVYNKGNFIMLDACLIANNIATYGGGVYNSGSSTYMANFTMSGGIIANNNVSGDGGGVYLSIGRVDVLGGVIANNVASGSGGGIWVTGSLVNITELERLSVANGVVFSNNRASKAYDRDPIHNTVYDAHIGSSVIWSDPFIQGYNNYDISYSGVSQLTICHITYNPNTGAGSMNDTAIVYNKNVTLTPNVFSKTGYTFVGWNTLANGTGTAYADHETFNYTYIGDLDLFAQWAVVSAFDFRVFYVGNGASGGAVPIDNNLYDLGDFVVVAGNSRGLYRDGYVFLGWAFNSSVTSPDFVVNGSGVLPVGFDIYGDVVLCAVWGVVPIVDTYTVIYQSGAHGTFTPVSHTGLAYGDNTPAIPTITGESGWTFTGWAPARTTTVTANVTYIAQWTQTTTPTPSPSASPSPSPSASASPSPSSSSSPTTTATQTPTSTNTASPTPSDNGGDGGDEKMPTWALVNLVLSVVGVMLSIITVIHILLQQKQKKQKQEKDKQKIAKNQNIANQNSTQSNATEEKRQTQHSKLWLFAAAVMSIAGIIVFLITEDMSRSITLMDKWTGVNVVIFIVELIAIAFAFKHTKKQHVYNPHT